ILFCTALFGCAVLSVAYAADETDANAWLERMTRSLAMRNYDGRFLRLGNGHAENMRIVHRMVGGVVTERLVSLDGSGREVIRTANEMICYLPDQRVVVVEPRTDQSSLFSTVPNYNANLKANYVVTSPASGRVMGRRVRLVSVEPRDEFRYGYRLWLDQESAMPLKSELCDPHGRAIEQVVFADLQLPSEITDDLLKPAMSTEGFRWIRQQKPPIVASQMSGWTVANPPQGFRLTITRIQIIGGSQVRHMVFSDGLAAVSVFIEPRMTDTTEKPGLARVGTANTFSTEIADHRVIAVGEVPESTVRALATSVARETPPRQ
ncbi:MAG TPA: MucB/RseB C-terminal domain-containing protein, partial [Steroidobacteraceae bacterium]|nr:MucB/RseB C-terminal domain-containing protein [Steroidobacteraceae bacterium]